MCDTQTPKQKLATAEEDLRFSSRKWILTKNSIILYTGVHLMNAAMILFASWKNLVPKESVETLWVSSLSTWSMGIGAITLIYMGGNVAAIVAKGKAGLA